MPHKLEKWRFNKPTWCQYCQDFIWGVGVKQGYKCTVCRYKCHKRCKEGAEKSHPCPNKRVKWPKHGSQDGKDTKKDKKPKKEKKEKQPKQRGAKPTKGQSQKDGLAALGLDPSIMDDVEVDGDDLDDSALTELNDPNFGARKRPQKKNNVDINSLARGAMEEVEVEVTEADMNDPDLLGELDGLGDGRNEKLPIEERIRLLTVEIIEDKKSCIEFKKEGFIQEARDIMQVYKQKENDLTELKRQQAQTANKEKNGAVIQHINSLIPQYKLAAAQTSKAGDMPRARLYLRTYKALEQALLVAQSGGTVDQSIIPPANPEDLIDPDQQPPSAAPRAASGTQPTASANQPAAGAAPSTAAGSGPFAALPDVTDEAFDPSNTSRLVSNDVLEWELQRIVTEKGEYASKRQTIPEELLERETVINTRMQVLVVRVQTQKLTVEQYQEDVKRAFFYERALANKLLAAGKKDWAKLALQRANIMKKELSEGGIELNEAETNKHQPLGAAATPSASPTPSKQSPTPTPKTSTPTPKTNTPTPKASTPTPKATTPAAAPKAVPPKVAPKQTTPQSSDAFDEENFDPRNLNNLYSNNILEWELQYVDKEIEQAKRQKLPIDDLTTRKQFIEIKLQSLIIGVQTGKISVESYGEEVQKKIEEEKAMAAMLMRHGKRDWASLALQRAKIMEKELEGGDEE